MILGVAIKQNNVIYKLEKPNRHHNVIKYMNRELQIKYLGSSGEQGFYNEKGEFLNREEALIYALNFKQITVHDHPRELFSEDLW